MSDLEGALQEDSPPPPPYIIFVVVFLFFMTGLGGFLLCHVLKLKGYRCTMEDDQDEDEDEEELDPDPDDNIEENQDTVEQILKCIIQNEANMEAFNEMVGKGNVCVRHDSRLRKESIGGLPPHLHTVHSGSDLHNTCHLCAQSRGRRGRRASRTPRLRQRSGEQTVFSVGRFRVTHTDKKSSDGSGRVPDVLVGSGDGLDQSLESEERRDAGFNLRNMFKDVRPPSDAPNVGKRRRSLTLFGLRRGSDPIGVKVVGSGKEGVRFIPQPAVLEEPQHENGDNGSQDVAKPSGETFEITAAQLKASSDISVIKKQTINSTTPESSTQGNNLQTKSTTAPVTSPPPSLPIIFNTSSKSSDQAVGRETKKRATLSPGPLQTSTPLSPLPNAREVTDQFAVEVPQGLPGSQTPPDPCTSPAPELDSFASPGLISLGSSPYSSIRTPPSPRVSSSPQLLSDQSPLRSLHKGVTLSPHTSSPSLKGYALPVEMSSQEPKIKSLIPMTLQGSTIQRSMPELENLGIRNDGEKSLSKFSTSTLAQTANQVPSLQGSTDITLLQGSTTQRSMPELENLLIPLDGDKGSSKFSTSTFAETVNQEPSLKGSTNVPILQGSTTQRSMPELENLGMLSDGDKGSPLLSPLSPLGGRVSSVAIIKASPDSKREFSVVTMVEEQTGAQKVDSEEPREDSGAEGKWILGDEKEDMVEMEEISECRVSVAGESRTVEENKTEEEEINEAM